MGSCSSYTKNRRSSSDKACCQKILPFEDIHFSSPMPSSMEIIDFFIQLKDLKGKKLSKVLFIY